MKRIISKECTNHLTKQVLLQGWLNSFRNIGKIAFLGLRDRGGIAQIVVEDRATIKQLQDLQPGSILTVTGTVTKTDQTELGFEITNPSVEVVTEVTESWPVEVNKKDINAHLDTILDQRPLTLRNEKISAVFTIQGLILEAYRKFLRSEGFTEFMGPSIIGASSEGGAELFNVDYFGTEAKLAQSNQLYKQMMVGVYERVFGSLKCFRAEKSNTRRHITEATQLEFEVGFIEGLDDVLDWEEKVVRAIVSHVQEHAHDLLEKYFPNAAKISNDAIPQFTLEEVLEIYFKETGVDDRGEDDLSPEAERFMCVYVKEKYNTDFVFVTHFPRSKCAFYAKPSAQNPNLCNYGDLLCNGAEVTSGGQRIDNYDELVESLKMKDLDPIDFTDYLSIFKYGMPKHGGFGMGLERFTMQFLGLENIREATLFPSDTKRIASVPMRNKGLDCKDDVVNCIKNLLDTKNIDYKFDEHEEVITSEDAARVRGTKLEQGAKAIILKGKKSGKNIMVTLPANKKVDMKAVKKEFGEEVTMEDPQIILEKWGIQVGGVPPFGNVLGLEVLFDSTLLVPKTLDFNAGKRTCSIQMNSADLLEVVEGKMGEWSK